MIGGYKPIHCFSQVVLVLEYNEYVVLVIEYNQLISLAERESSYPVEEEDNEYVVLVIEYNEYFVLVIEYTEYVVFAMYIMCALCFQVPLRSALLSPLPATQN